MLSDKKRNTLDKLFKYLPSLRKDQFGAAGNIAVGEYIGDGSLVVAKKFVINADPFDVVLPRLLATDDVAVVTLVQDDTGGTLGAIAVSIPADGTLRIDPANAPTNDDGIVYVQVTRDIE